jgi:hypothetical protein
MFMLKGYCARTDFAMANFLAFALLASRAAAVAFVRSLPLIFAHLALAARRAHSLTVISCLVMAALYARIDISQ